MFRWQIAAALLIPGVRHFKEADINVFRVCNAHARESLLRETARQDHMKLTGTLLTCSRCVKVNGRRASGMTTPSSRMTQPLQCDFLGRAGFKKNISAWGPVPNSVQG